MTLIVVDVEFVERDIVKELGVYIDGHVLGYSFKPPKEYKPSKQALWCTQNLHQIAWDSGSLSYKTIPGILKVVTTHKATFLAKGTEKCKIIAKLMGVHVENLEDYGCPKIEQLEMSTDECSNYPIQHKHCLHCAERKVKTFGDWARIHVKV